MKLIYLFSLLSACSIVAYSAVFWYYHHFRPFELDRSIPGFIIPAILTILLVLIFLRPAVIASPLFSFNVKNINEFLLFLAGLGIFVPLYFSSEYMKYFRPRVIEITSPAGVIVNKPGTFYNIDNFYADKQRAGSYFASHVAGKSAEYTRLGVYFACPLLSLESESGKPAKIWTGTYYSRTNNRFAKNGFKMGFDEFTQQSNEAFQQKDFSQQKSFYIPERSAFRENMDSAIKNSPANNPAIQPVLLYPMDDSLNHQQSIRFQWLIFTFLGGIIYWGLLVLLLNYFRQPA